MRRIYAVGPLLNDPDRGYAMTIVDDDQAADGGMVAELGDTALEALERIVLRLGSQEFVVGPELRPEAERLGLEVAEHPLIVKRWRALAGFVLKAKQWVDSDVDHGVLEMLVQTATPFAAAAPWRWASGAVIKGQINEQGKRATNLLVSMLGGDEPAIMVHPQTRSLARALGRRNKSGDRDSVLAMTLMQEPAWLRDALREGFDLDSVPHFFKIRREQQLPISSDELWLLASVVAAASDLEQGTAGSDLELEIEHRPPVVVSLTLPDDSADEPAPALEQATIVNKKTPRNAPCPCGSGRKYKRCCLVDPQSSRASSRSSRSSRPQARTSSSPRERLTDKLVEFARRQHSEHFERVSAELLGGDVQRGSIVTPMILFDLPLAHGQTIAAEFFNSERTSQQEHRLLTASMSGVLSIWEALRVEPGRGFEAVDRLTGDRAFVHEILGLQALRARSGMLGRGIKVDGRLVLDGVFPMMLPPDRTDAAIAAVRRAIGGRRQRFDHVDIVEPRIVRAMFDAWSDEVAQFELGLADLHTIEVITTDGEPFAKTVDEFAIQADDGDSIFAALLKLPEVRDTSDSDDPRALTFVRKGNAMHDDWLNTALGTVSVKSKLVLETDSLARADRLRSVIEAKLGARVQHQSRKVAPQSPLEVPTRVKGPFAMDAQLLGNWLKPPAEMTEAARLVQWQHQAIDRLDGQTPREAVEQVGSRRKLHDLLREMEYDSPDGVLSKVIAQLRADLGLDDEGRRIRIKPHTRALGMGRKASQTLLEFALPLLLGSPNAALGEAILRTAEVVWNQPEQSVTTLVGAAKAALARAETKVAVETASLREWVELLLERRRWQSEDQRVFEIRSLDLEDDQVAVQVATLIHDANILDVARRHERAR